MSCLVRVYALATARPAHGAGAAPNPGVSGQHVLVFGARPQGPGVTYVDHYRLLGVLPEDADEVVDITDLYVARFPVLLAGKRIYIQTVQQINGWRDRPKTTSARVLAA